MSKEYALDLGDLKLIDVVCGKCNREMIVDLSLSEMPTACWSCKKDFERSFTEALSHLYKAYRAYRKKPGASTARIWLRREVNAAEL
jgi:hypothetical protein